MFAIYTLNEPATNSSAKICPERGGILISFVSHGKELLYLDEDTFSDPTKNVRGGNPILFPICGQLPNCTYNWNGTSYNMKNHGVARISPWKVEAFQEEGPGPYLTISLESSAETLGSYPFAFRLVFTYRLEGGKLTIEQSIRHLGNATSGKMPVHTGFHPYFKVSGKTICHNLTAPTYFDYNDNCKKPLESTYDAANKVEAVVTTANADGSIVFYEADGAADCIADCVASSVAGAVAGSVAGTSRKIRISTSPEYRYWMLWSVDGCDFLCVEPWTAKNQEILRGDELLMVAPGEELNLWVSMELVE